MDDRELENDARVSEVAGRLKPKFDRGKGPLSGEEVDGVIEETVEELRDAPVQTFVPLIAENKARRRLQERADRRRRDGTETPVTEA
jgi:hypothetical protein